MPDTRESAIAYVVAELEAKGTATRDDFDVAMIVSVSREVAGGWDFHTIDRKTFWGIAASNLRF